MRERIWGTNSSGSARFDFHFSPDSNHCVIRVRIKLCVNPSIFPDEGRHRMFVAGIGTVDHGSRDFCLRTTSKIVVWAD